MEITGVRVKLISPATDKLRAFCCITIDDAFVVRDLKIIEGIRGIEIRNKSKIRKTQNSHHKRHKAHKE